MEYDNLGSFPPLPKTKHTFTADPEALAAQAEHWERQKLGPLGHDPFPNVTLPPLNVPERTMRGLGSAAADVEVATVVPVEV